MSATASEPVRALIEASARNRAAFAACSARLEQRCAVAEMVVSSARRLNRHRGAVGTAALFLLLAPGPARAWMRRALWLVPVALEIYRAARKPGRG